MRRLKCDRELSRQLQITKPKRTIDFMVAQTEAEVMKSKTKWMMMIYNGTTASTPAETTSA